MYTEVTLQPVEPEGMPIKGRIVGSTLFLKDEPGHIGYHYRVMDVVSELGVEYFETESLSIMPTILNELVGGEPVLTFKEAV